MKKLIVVMLLIAASISAAAPAANPPQPPAGPPPIDAATLDMYTLSPVVYVTGEYRAQPHLDDPGFFEHGPVGLGADIVFRGRVAKGELIYVNLNSGEGDGPGRPIPACVPDGFKLVEGQRYIVAVPENPDPHAIRTLISIEVATPERIEQVAAACRVPMGWRIVDGRLLCPWSSLDAKWPANDRMPPSMPRCAATNRPAMLFPSPLQFRDFLQFNCQPVEVWQKPSINPQGDGSFTLTIYNQLNKPQLIQALRQRDGKILWNESLVIAHNGKAYPAPGAQGISEPTEPVVVQPRQSVSVVINVLELKGIDWGDKQTTHQFMFILGDRTVSHTFTYTPQHHGKLLK